VFRSVKAERQAWRSLQFTPYGAPMHEFLTFASDADILAMWGAGFLMLALFTLVMDRRRNRRARIDRIGWMPWTGLFLTFAVIGGGLLAVAIPGMLRG
tara:strand:- start:127 stop:420 length:294 start_codon:yes stop_codon:yes gene_type:complete